MNNYEFGRLIRALRMQSRGLHGAPLSRRELGAAVHLSQEQLGRLERGERKHLDSGTLMSLSRALNLSSVEARQLFAIANGLEDRYPEGSAEGPAAILSSLAKDLQDFHAPALVLDSFADIIMVNWSALRILALSPAYLDHLSRTAAGYNFMRFVFFPESGFRDMAGDEWVHITESKLLFFRRVSFLRRHTPYFESLFRVLSGNSDFVVHWYSTGRINSALKSTLFRYKLDHPFYGLLDLFLSEMVTETRHGELYLVILSPADQRTAAFMTRIIAAEGNVVRYLAPWPEKPLFIKERA